jgi:hypothetical protein
VTGEPLPDGRGSDRSRARQPAVAVTELAEAPGHNQRNVVLLFIRAELPNLIDNRRDHGLWGQFPMPVQRFDQARFSELLTRIVERFGDPIGVEYQHVSREEPMLRHRAIPVFEEPQHGARCPQLT